MSNSIWQSLTNCAVRASGVGGVWEELLSLLITIVHEELQPLEEKIDRLLSSPFKQAEALLRQATTTKSSARRKQLYGEARQKFTEASYNLDGLPAAKSMILVGVCCSLEEDPNGAKFWYEEALKCAKKRLEKLEEITVGKVLNAASYVVRVPLYILLLPTGAGGIQARADVLGITDEPSEEHLISKFIDETSPLLKEI